MSNELHMLSAMASDKKYLMSNALHMLSAMASDKKSAQIRYYSNTHKLRETNSLT